MNWDDLRFFLAVAREGSVRGAAHKMGVNHSTVARRVSALEDDLGARMFERLPGGYLLTPVGEDLLRSAERIEAETLSLEREVTGRDEELRGDLQFTLPDSAALGLLMPDLARFTQLHPEIRLTLLLSYDVIDLSARRADCALRFSNDPAPNLVGRRLMKMSKAIYASPAYLGGRDVRSAAEEDLTWIGWRDAVKDPQWVRESPFPGAPVRNCVPHSVAQVEAAKAGMGMAMLPCFLGDGEPMLQRVVPDVAPDRDIWILTHQELRRTARVRSFIEFVADALKSKRNLIEGKEPRNP